MKKLFIIALLFYAAIGTAFALQVKQSTTAPVYVLLVDATDGYTEETGITSPTVSYVTGAGTVGVLGSPTFSEISAGTTPGLYKLIIDGTMTGSLGELIVYVAKTGCRTFKKSIDIAANLESDSYGIVNNGTYGNSALNTKLDSTIPVNVVKIVGAAVNTSAAQLGVNTVTNADKTGYYLGHTAPVNVVQILGSAVSTSSAQLGVNAVQIGAAVPSSATIGTVTNVTNPTLTATGTGAGQLSITSGAVTVGTNNDKTGYALSSTVPVNVVQILGSPVSTTTAQLGVNVVTLGGTAPGTMLKVSIWDEAQSSHTTAGTFGKYLDAQVSTVGGGTAADIADAVWDEATSGHTTTGTTGKALIDAGAAGNPWNTDISTGYTGLAGEYVRSIYQNTNGVKDGGVYQDLEKMIRSR